MFNQLHTNFCSHVAEQCSTRCAHGCPGHWPCPATDHQEHTAAEQSWFSPFRRGCTQWPDTGWRMRVRRMLVVCALVWSGGFWRSRVLLWSRQDIGWPLLEKEDFCLEQNKTRLTYSEEQQLTRAARRGGSLIFCRVHSDLIFYPSLDEILKCSCFVWVSDGCAVTLSDVGVL